MNSLSLRISQSVNDAINKIYLSFNSDLEKSKIFLYLEGKDDARIYLKLIDTKTVLIRTLDGKKRLKKVLQKFSAKTKQVIAICDADFEYLNKKPPEFETLFYTDKHDIEMTMLSFPDIVEKVFCEFLIPDKAEEYLKDALDSISYFSYIRWYNDIKETGLDFEKVKTSSFIRESSHNEIIEKINNNSKDKTDTITSNDIDKFIHSNKTDDIFNLCCGHDTINMLSYIGNIDHTKIEMSLRGNFQITDFCKTTLFKSINEWEIKNKFSLLRKN